MDGSLCLVKSLRRVDVCVFLLLLSAWRRRSWSRSLSTSASACSALFSRNSARLRSIAVRDSCTYAGWGHARCKRQRMPRKGGCDPNSEARRRGPGGASPPPRTCASALSRPNDCSVRSYTAISAGCSGYCMAAPLRFLTLFSRPVLFLENTSSLITAGEARHDAESTTSDEGRDVRLRTRDRRGSTQAAASHHWLSHSGMDIEIELHQTSYTYGYGVRLRHVCVYTVCVRTVAG